MIGSQDIELDDFGNAGSTDSQAKKSTLPLNSASKPRVTIASEVIEMRERNTENTETETNSSEDIKMLREKSKLKYSIHSVSWKCPLGFLIVGLLIYYSVYLLDYSLPNVVSVHESKKNTDAFSGERSHVILKKITDIGQRIVGTLENEMLTPSLIQEELQNLKDNSSTSQVLLYEVQKGSGAYNLEYKPPFANVYQNIKNVVAILKGSSGKHSLLVNCHYDSVPSSVGASDDAISCAVMLEVVRVLASAKKRLKHNVVFLFNGAEETALMASHMFVQHKWFSTVRVFLNLEAAGLGGREILFQSGPKHAWLFDYYARYAPHPHAQVLGEELFQSGFIPSDTDFRIFRDFGNIPGLDFAFARNGYVYHTIYDREEYITPGSHQHMGDNLLEVIRHLGNAPELENIMDNNYGSMVYFDYLGWFMVRYSSTAGVVINIFVVILSIFSVVLFIGRLLQWSWLPQGMGPLSILKVPRVLRQHIRKDSLVKLFRRKKKNTVTYKHSDYLYVNQKLPRVVPENSNEQVGRDVQSDETAKPAEQLPVSDKDKITKEVHMKMKGTHALLELAISFGSRIGGMVAAVLVNAIMGVFVNDVASLAMPFYSNSYLVFPLYWCPALAAYILIPMLIDNWREHKIGLSLSLHTQLNLVAAQIPFAILLFIATCAGIRSAAIIMVVVLFSALANIIIHITPVYRSVHKWIWVYLLIHIPSFIYQTYVVYIGYTFFLPIMGRSGAINADLYIAIISAIFLIYLLNFVLPLMTLVKKSWMIVLGLTVVTLVMLPVTLGTQLGMPYRKGPSNPAPQRYWIMHTERRFMDKSGVMRRNDYGYFILNLDPNSPRTIPEHITTGMQTLTEDCQREMFCGVPLYMGRMIALSRKSHWIPSKNAPYHPEQTNLTLVSKNCSTGECTLNFSIEGPDRLTVTFVPRDGVVLSSWSHPDPPLPTADWNGRPGYLMHIVRGEVTGSFELELNFKVKSGNTTDVSLVDIGVAGIHVHHEKKRTFEYMEFLKSFPSYVTMIGWISSYTAYVF